MIDRLLADIKSLMEPYCFYKWHQQESWSRTDDYIESIVQLISEINSGVRTHAFSSQAEEIRYFKEVKPLIETEYVFISTLKRFYENSSPIDLDLPKTYKKQINHLRAFINEEKDFYCYIKKKHTHQDALFLDAWLILVWRVQPTASMPIRKLAALMGCCWLNCWLTKN